MPGKKVANKSKKSANVPKREIVILIPAYNEGRIIKRTIAQLEPYFENIVCVNDGSRDDTADQIQKTSAQLISHPINLGQGAALRTAFDYALLNTNYKYFVTFDADGQHRPSDAKKMVNFMRQEGVDVVLGSRFLGETRHSTRSRRALLKAAVVFTNLTSGIKLSDAHNGLRVFSRGAAERLQLTMPDMAHASEINHRIKEQHMTFAEFPVTITYSEYSTRKGQSALNSINIAFDILLHKVTKK